MKKYNVFYTILSLLMVLASCKPNTNKSTDTLSITGFNEVKSIQNMRKIRSTPNQPQLVEVSTPTPTPGPIFVINKETIPERARRNALNRKEFHATHKIYYLPVPKNISERNLDIIQYTLSLGNWITHLPQGVNYSRLYFQQKKDAGVNLFEVVSASIDDTIELNFENLKNPIAKIHKGDGSEIIADGDLFRDLVYIEPFNFPWNTYDLDISLANDISDSYPIKAGDTFNLLFIQVIEYKRSNTGHYHYYLNPINLDNLDLISYTLNSK